MKKIFISIAIIFIVVGTSKSQSKDEGGKGDKVDRGIPIEFAVNAGGGLSGASYKNAAIKPGGNFGLSAMYLINDSWSAGIGAEMALYRSGVANDFNEISLYQMKYAEDYTSLFLNIPVMGRYMYTLPFATTNGGVAESGYVGPVNAMNHKLYALVGVKVAIPISTKLNQSASNLSIQGVDYNTDNISKSPLKPNIGIALSAEIGYNYPLPVAGVNLYGGVYCDYGITNLYKKTSENLVEFADDGKPIINSYVAISPRVNNMAVGIMLRATFSHNFHWDFDFSELFSVFVPDPMPTSIEYSPAIMSR